MKKQVLCPDSVPKITGMQNIFSLSFLNNNRWLYEPTIFIQFSMNLTVSLVKILNLYLFNSFGKKLWSIQSDNIESWGHIWWKMFIEVGNVQYNNYNLKQRTCMKLCLLFNLMTLLTATDLYLKLGTDTDDTICLQVLYKILFRSMNSYKYGPSVIIWGYVQQI